MVDHAPLPLLTNPHEVALAVALLAIGMGLLVGDLNPASVTAQVPPLIRDGWAWFLFVGSLLTIGGVFGPHPRAEWLGQLLLGWGSAFYAVAVLLSAGIEVGGVVASVFTAVAFVSFFQAFKITSSGFVAYRLTVEAAKTAAQAVRDLSRPKRDG